MEKLVRGVETFRNKRLGGYQELFQRLAHRQTPETLFITGGMLGGIALAHH